MESACLFSAYLFTRAEHRFYLQPMKGKPHVLRVHGDQLVRVHGEEHVRAHDEELAVGVVDDTHLVEERGGVGLVPGHWLMSAKALADGVLDGATCC